MNSTLTAGLYRFLLLSFVHTTSFTLRNFAKLYQKHRPAGHKTKFADAPFDVDDATVANKMLTVLGGNIKQTLP